MRLIFSLFLFTIFSVPTLAAEPTNFRVGLGALNYSLESSQSGTPDTQLSGLTLLAEYPQDNYHGSRFILYHTDEQNQQSWGYETQLMLGCGLAQPGFRIHTGPAWHREFVYLKDDTEFFNGWGWQLGVGWQQQAVTLELAATYRDPQDYEKAYKSAHQSDSNIDPILGNLFVSYRF